MTNDKWRLQIYILCHINYKLTTKNPEDNVYVSRILRDEIWVSCFDILYSNFRIQSYPTQYRVYSLWNTRFRHYYVQEISYYVQAPGHNKRYFPVLLAWHSVRELRKLSSCCYYVQFGGHDNYNISTGSPYKYRIVLIVNNW